MNFNITILSGRLTGDPEVKQVGQTSLTTFSIAVNQGYKDKQGEWQDKTMFIECKAWAGYGEYLAGTLEKGKYAVIQGSLELETWETQEGYKRQKHTLKVDRVDTAPEKKVETESNKGTKAPASVNDPFTGQNIPF
jgi:single-strand DNA-binding protein